MKGIIQLMKKFEERNNLSIKLDLYSDGSSSVEELWDEELLFMGDNIEQLEEFLVNRQYKLDERGLSFSPVIIIK